MNGEIIGEDEEDIGTKVTDNNNIVHQIEMHKNDGKIYAHGQNGYPDKADERTPEGNEHVNQARRYARYYVNNERGYETFQWDENVPRIKAVGEAIEALSTDEFEAYFGEFHEAVAGPASDQDDLSIVDLISSVSREANAYYIDVFLDENDQIEATSDIHPVISGQDWQADITTPTKYDGRVPDARIDLIPVPLSDIELFRQIVSLQVKCQVRDYYIVMGEEPPEEYRVLGFGKYKFALKYNDGDLSMYDDYTRLEADIPGYRIDFDLGDDRWV